MLTEADNRLLDMARNIIRQRYKEGFHHIGAALRTRSGKEFCAVHLEAHVGRIAVCAEAIAMGMAAAKGDTKIQTIVAVNHQGDVVPPCGMCRELISDYAPDASVILQDEGKLIKIGISELLPRKYQRPKQV